MQAMEMELENQAMHASENGVKAKIKQNAQKNAQVKCSSKVLE